MNVNMIPEYCCCVCSGIYFMPYDVCNLEKIQCPCPRRTDHDLYFLDIQTRHDAHGNLFERLCVPQNRIPGRACALPTHRQHGAYDWFCRWWPCDVPLWLVHTTKLSVGLSALSVRVHHPRTLAAHLPFPAYFRCAYESWKWCFLVNNPHARTQSDQKYGERFLLVHG